MMEAKAGKGIFNRQRKSTMKPVQSGIVINEATEMSNNSNSGAEDTLEEPQTFKRDADQYMPIANVTRIMRGILPPNAKISDDAKETIQECVSEFIGFVTTVANEKCHQEFRKTITPRDVLSAMVDLGFDKYVESLTSYYDKIHNQDSEGNPKQQRYHARRETNFGQPKKQAMMVHMTPTNYTLPPLPPPRVYNGDPYVEISQMNNYYVQNGGGRHGEGSANKFVFDPFNKFH